MGRLADLLEAFDAQLVHRAPPAVHAPDEVARTTPASDALAGTQSTAALTATAFPEPPVALATRSVAIPPALIPAASMDAESLLLQEGIALQYITTAADAAQAVEELTSGDVQIGFDIETAKLERYAPHPKAGLRPQLSTIRLAQFYAGGRTVYVFDVAAVGLLPLAPLWIRRLVAHNALFELEHLMHARVFPDDPDCTLLQANALDGTLPSLADLARKHLGWPLSKDLQVSDWGNPELTPAQLGYAALDAVVVYRIASLQAAQIEARNRSRCYRLMKGAQRAIASLELSGLHFDGEAHAKLCIAWQETLQHRESELSALLGAGVNPASGKQLADWLTGHVEPKFLARWPTTSTGQLKTDTGTLKRFATHSLVAPLLAYKEAHKLVSAYGPRYPQHLDPATDRIHSSFKLGGTATGRLSCSEPNVQNVPRDARFRALFSAPPGRCLVVADYNQMELRIAALVSGDDAMLDAYTQGVDLHRKTAAAIVGVPAESVTHEQRQMAKAVNFGLLFGMGAPGLAAYARTSYGISMTEEEARNARVRFLSTYPGLSAWQRQQARKVAGAMRTVTPAGRVRDFRNDPRGYRSTEALNTPIQGGAAEVLLAALGRLPSALAGLDGFLVNVVHDEILVEAAERDAPEAKARLERVMIAAMLDIFPNATTRGLVEARIATDWGDVA